MTDIFIIDDEEQIAEMLGEVVSLSGFEAITYTDATHFFTESRFGDDSIIILDLNMPNMDGIEVIRELSKCNSKASLILMSGYDVSVLHSAEKLAKAHKLEIMTSIMKPIQFDELVSVLDNHRDTLSSSEPSYKVRSFMPTASDLRSAIDNNELILHYQPQIDLKTSQCIGAEVLVRWLSPEHGLLYPDSFISLAEQSGLIGDLTTRVIDLAIKRIAIHQSQNCSLPLSVNVSAENINSLVLPENLEEKVRLSHLNPNLLTIEVTESALMGELVTSLDILTRLRMKGFSLSIDDFGTGFSSLSQLHKVPFNELKVDQSFVKDMDVDDEAKSIVKTCIMLGHELNMRVVAEGVESEKTLDILKQLGCDVAQGYCISYPLPEAEFQQWIESCECACCEKLTAGIS